MLGSTFKDLISKNERITVARKYADINLDLENKKRFETKKLTKKNKRIPYQYTHKMQNLKKEIKIILELRLTN